MPRMHQDRSIRVGAVAAVGMLCLGMLAVAAGRTDESTPTQPPPAEAAEPSDPPVQAPEAVEPPSEGLSEPDSPEGASDAPPQRVILHINRNTSVAGWLQLESDDVIVVRTRRGEVQSYPKVRVLQIVRLVEPEPGQRGVVKLTNGQVREGVILEDHFDHVLVEIEGIPAKLRREFVDHVYLEPTFQQQYEQYRAALRPHMIEQRLTLCRWLIEQRRYDLAHENLLELLAEHDHHEAERLLHVVNAQLALQADRPSADTAESQPSGDEASGPSKLPPPLLSAEQVNLIRVYEVDFEHPPRLTVHPETVRKLFRDYGTHEAIPATQNERNAMVRGDAAELVRLMFQLRARELYPEIQVDSEPHALNQFRLRVHNTWLLNNCATSGCHGGPDAGALYLHRQNYTNERVRFTNFMILERLQTDPQWPLINYEEPEMSLIIQYGLPRQAARLAHPEVRGWRPVFTKLNDRMKEQSIQWIESMMQPRPAYPIDFDPHPVVLEPREPGEAEEEPDVPAESAS